MNDSSRCEHWSPTLQGDNGHGAYRASLSHVVLTPRQRQTLTHAANGMTDREIGEALGMAPQTVRHTLQAARKQLGASNTAHAVKIALENKLID